MIRKSVFVFSLVLGMLPAFSGAQEACEIVLRAAERAYQEGRIEEVLAVREGCTRGKATREQRAKAYELLSKVHIALDEIGKARGSIRDLLAVAPDFKPAERDDPVRFVALVEEMKVAATVVTVVSVSKSDEPLREAPATVVVVTAEQIQRRGYLDLEAVLHDLPGLDISTANGDLYSNIYQRGLRSNGNTRLLLLVDGVEENDMFANIAYLSRQYPISNIERVEVIYGPASTMYGANAFAGVIHVITKQPADLVAEGKRLGVQAVATSGSFGTTSLETTLAGRSGNGSVSWSLTGRTFQSDEMDRSRYSDWDFDPAFFEFIPYQSFLRLEGVRREEFLSFLAQIPSLDCRGQEGCFYEVTDVSVELTEAGIQRAKELDQSLYLNGGPNGGPLRFTDETEDWSVSGKLVVANLELGIQSWSRREGEIGDITDFVSAGSDEGAIEIHEKDTLYLKYSRSFRNSLNLSLFSRYKVTRSNNSRAVPVTYALGVFPLELLVLGQPAFLLNDRTYLRASQLRTELSLTYNPSPRLSLVSGVEFRDSSVPAISLFTCPELNLSIDFESCKLDPRQTGLPPFQIPGGNQINSQDLGVYAQLAYKPWKDLKVVLGGRVDNNESQPSEGYGTVFNPRLAVVYPVRNLVFKAVYAEAFKSPSNLERFDQDVPNIDLKEEIVKNLEFSVSWQPREDLTLELGAYDSKYSDLVELRFEFCDPTVTECETPLVGTNRNTGLLRIKGAQANFSLQYNNLDFYGNYTYTEPYNIDPLDPEDPNDGPLRDSEGNSIPRIRISDIASHQLNIGLNAVFFKKLNFNLRANYVDSKPTGVGTTAPSNPLSEIDSYFVANATVTWEDPLPGFDLSVVVNNVFDEEYFHPGTAVADGLVLASQIPQRRRGVYVRGSFRF